MRQYDREQGKCGLALFLGGEASSGFVRGYSGQRREELQSP